MCRDGAIVSGWHPNPAPAIGGTDGQDEDDQEGHHGDAELKKALAVVRGQLTKTRTKLTKANEKTDRWKKEAAAHRTAASRSDARAEKLQHKLDRATAALKPSPTTNQGRSLSRLHQRTQHRLRSLTAPDETWTVVQLRAEAHAQDSPGCRTN